MCENCHKKNHTRKTYWDLHGWPNSSRDRTGHDGGCCNRSRGHGRDRGMECGGSGCQQAHVADTVSQSSSGIDDKMTQLMIQLAARVTSTIPTSATTPIVFYGHNISSLLTTVVKSVGTIMKALVAEPSVDMSWIVDSGASKHMTPHSTMFKIYKHMSGKDKVQTVDDSLRPIAGVGDITCTPELQLSSVLHDPNFTNNLLSVGQLVDDLNCVILLSPSYSCCVAGA
jgi:hypothetical protein